jgi:hypothetical protein
MSTGIESSALLGAEVPLSHRVGILGFGGMQRHADGTLDPRDASLGVSWTPFSRPEYVLRLVAGLNIPTGGIGSGLFITPLSTASFDPVLMADTVWGRTWLASGTLVARVPVYDGWDQIRQGTFLRVDVRGARRIGDVVPWLGVSGVRQFASDPRGAAPDLEEIAGTAGAVANLSPRWSLTGQMRGSLLVSEGTERQLSGGLTLRVVVGNHAHEHAHEE